MVGEIPMGAEPDFKVKPTQCAMIHTGGMLPEGTNAVVMVENTQKSQQDEIEVMRSVAIGENIIEVGEDIKFGERLLPTGKQIRESDIGGLMAMGVTTLSAAQIPKVGIISTGDEIISPEIELSPGQVRDINSYSLSAVVSRYGGMPLLYGIIPDEEETLQKIAQNALKECEMILITAGSSVSHRDITSLVINKLGKPGVLVHGVNIRPGKPTILSVCEGKPVIGLPGNPVSALVIAKLFVVPILERLLGVTNKKPTATVTAELTVNLSSQSGREDWIPVRIITNEQNEYKADPIFGKSNLIFTLVKSDGLIRISPDDTGISAGEHVEVVLL
jgi:molybdopterin molybdotransferase